MSKIVTRYCWICRKPIEISETSSLYKPDGEPYMIFCYACWQEHMEGKAPGYE